jgi:hypothetical protein
MPSDEGDDSGILDIVGDDPNELTVPVPLTGNGNGFQIA